MDSQFTLKSLDYIIIIIMSSFVFGRGDYSCRISGCKHAAIKKQKKHVNDVASRSSHSAKWNLNQLVYKFVRTKICKSEGNKSMKHYRLDTKLNSLGDNVQFSRFFFWPRYQTLLYAINMKGRHRKINTIYLLVYKQSKHTPGIVHQFHTCIYHCIIHWSSVP